MDQKVYQFRALGLLVDTLRERMVGIQWGCLPDGKLDSYVVESSSLLLTWDVLFRRNAM